MGKAAVALVPEAVPRYPAATHIVSQIKGGVGKSVIASWVAQYLVSADRKPVCFDLDPGQHTFCRFESLEVRPIDLLDKGEINPALYDAMVESLFVSDGPFVIDTGSDGFRAFWNYVRRNELFESLTEGGKAPIVHVPIAPRPDLDDTIEGFNLICDHCAEKSVVVWLNQRDQEIKLNGKDFLDLGIVEASRAKILGVVVNSRQTYALHRQAVAKMLDQNWTFSEGIVQQQLMEQKRLCQVRDEVFEQLGRIGL